ncbi:DUF429 domain-containing protein [Infirmifilum lucidum]|uniref:DUF429 domain-containing protein n=1 Tax=Infirmifilum lucidum TaxID=2776706 RepID=A0A7L9FF93_9CREN|nr:DUF429 domain-containing protein [Infirmifilum lucidum]QOJ78468.1 DUF429 domain-containing protein [Infirmifilum lucidum]
MLLAGVDLSASSRKPTYISLLDEDLRAGILSASEDSEIIEVLREAKPSIVGIDAPLSLPLKGGVRGCERILASLGVRFFPPMIPSMAALTRRGIRLRSALEALGFVVIEVYPGGSQDLLCIPRKKSLSRLREGLEGLGVRLPPGRLSGDALDAVTAAYTVFLYSSGDYLRITSEDCSLVLPLPRCLPRSPTRRY